jgi:transposase
MTREKTSGVKIHIGVDTNGLPHTLFVSTANIADRLGTLEMLRPYAPELSKHGVKIMGDGGYSGEKFAYEVDSLAGAGAEIVKRGELHKFAVLPKRWVVERTFAWLDKCRRLWKNCERKIPTTLQMIFLAFVSLLLKRY